MAYIREYDWEGEEKPAAMVFLSTTLRIRLTDPGKNPVAGGRCRVAAAPDTIYECDAGGIVEIPILDRSKKQLDLEWEKPGSEESFPWSGTFDVEIPSAQDPDCEKRLIHLGFDGETLAERVASYQGFFGLPATGLLADIRDDLVYWHDGGEYPAQAPSSAGKAKTPGDAPGTGTAQPAAPAPAASIGPRDVMIVPDDAAAAGNSVYAENVKFANQWVKFQPDKRDMVRVGANGDLEKAIQDAVKKGRPANAKEGDATPRKLILFVGHGGAGDTAVKTMTAFDTLPEPGKFAAHLHKITEYAVDLGMLIRSGEMVVVDPNPQAPDIRAKGGPKQTESAGTPHDEKMAVRYAKVLQLQRIGALLKQNGITELALLSCSVGADTRFAQGLATLLGVKVGLYKDKVATVDVGNGLVQIWLSPHDAKTDQEKMQGRPPLQFDAKKRPKEHPSLHEYPAPQITR